MEENSRLSGKKGTSIADWMQLLKSLRDFSGHDLWLMVGVVTVASFVEGFGLALLLPLGHLLFSADGQAEGVSGSILDGLAYVGLTDTAHQLLALALVFLAWMGVRALFLISRDRRLAVLTNGYVDYLRLQMFASLAYAPWPVIRRMRKSDLMNALTTEISRISVAIQFLSKLFITMTLSGAYLIAGFLINPMIGLILLGLSSAAVVLGHFWSLGSGGMGKSLTRKNRKSMFVTTNFLDGLKTSKVFGAEDVFIGEFESFITQTRNLKTSFDVRQSKFRYGIELSGALAGLLLMLVGFQLLGIAGAELLVLGVIIVRLAPSLLLSLSSFQSLVFAMPAFSTALTDRQLIEQQSQARPQARSNQKKQDVPEPAEVTLKDVTVTIEEQGARLNLLRIDDICLPATGLVHLSGASGAGKSTFAELLAGLYLATSGEVRAGDLILTPATLVEWQRRISFAPQESFLFHGSIRENLCWPNLKRDDVDLWEALKAVHADDFVRSLPNGLSQHIRDGGNRLSGGERQRLCLARALLRSSAILIVDEGMSAVESDLEEKILTNLRRIARTKVVVCVSHSPTILTMADHVIEVSHGGAVLLPDHSSRA